MTVHAFVAFATLCAILCAASAWNVCDQQTDEGDCVQVASSCAWCHSTKTCVSWDPCKHGPSGTSRDTECPSVFNASVSDWKTLAQCTPCSVGTYVATAAFVTFALIMVLCMCGLVFARFSRAEYDAL